MAKPAKSTEKPIAAPLLASEAEAATTPAPHPPLNVSTVQLKAGTLLHRVHPQQYHATQFNPGMHGNARFSPITTHAGDPIPTLYGGATKECALMETVFHDVPYASGLKTLDKNKLLALVHSILEVTEALELIDLSSVPLRKLGITRKQLIDTEKDQYPATRLWAQELHHQCPHAQGLSWISRQDDSARAVILFGDRINKGILTLTGHSQSLSDDPDTYNAVLNLAGRLDVLIVSGK